MESLIMGIRSFFKSVSDFSKETEVSGIYFIVENSSYCNRKRSIVRLTGQMCDSSTTSLGVANAVWFFINNVLTSQRAKAQPNQKRWNPSLALLAQRHRAQRRYFYFLHSMQYVHLHLYSNPDRQFEWDPTDLFQVRKSESVHSNGQTKAKATSQLLEPRKDKVGQQVQWNCLWYKHQRCYSCHLFKSVWQINHSASENNLSFYAKILKFCCLGV